MTIADLLQIVRKHLASAIISFVVVFAAVAAVTFIMPPKYTATAEVFATYAGQSGETQTTNDMSSGANYLNTQIKTYPELVKTEAVLQPVIKDLGLDMTTTDLADVVTATNPTNTFMVDISAVRSKRPTSPTAWRRTSPIRFLPTCTTTPLPAALPSSSR